MGNCVFLQYVDHSEWSSESLCSKEKKTVIVWHPSANSLKLETSSSSSSVVGSITSFSKRASWSDNKDETSPPKIKVVQSNPIGTVYAHKHGEHDRGSLEESPRDSFLKHYIGPRGIRGGSYGGRDSERHSDGSLTSKLGASIQRKDLSTGLSLGKRETPISDWNECFTSSGKIRISKTYPDIQSVSWGISSQSMPTLNSTSPKRKSLIVHEYVNSTTPEMPVTPDMVWAMLLKKKGQAFQLLNLSFSLRKVVDTFLKVETGSSLPVSFTLPVNTRPKLLSADKMSMTLSENLKGYLDEATHGLTFVVGPINGKLCYKMTVCDLKQLQSVAITKKRD